MVFNRPLLDDAPGIHDDDTIADAADDAEIVGDDDDRGAVACRGSRETGPGFLPGWWRRARWSARRQAAASARSHSPWRSGCAGACRPTVRADIALSLASGAVKCTERNSSTSRACTMFAAVPPRVASTSTNLIADGEQRVERRHRVLQDHGNFAPAQLTQFARRHRKDRAFVKCHLARDTRGARQRANKRGA